MDGCADAKGPAAGDAAFSADDADVIDMADAKEKAAAVCASPPNGLLAAWLIAVDDDEALLKLNDAKLKAGDGVLDGAGLVSADNGGAATDSIDAAACR